MTTTSPTTLEEDITMRLPRIDPKDATGLYDKVVGLGKEVVGEVFDEQRLIEAGEAQQAKGSEKLKAIREQAKADGHRAKARTYEAREQSAQKAKV
jgi:uncharacterized protein YjbJ (UPF0337 family)